MKNSRSLATFQVTTGLATAVVVLFGLFNRGSGASQNVDTLHGPVEVLSDGFFAGAAPNVVSEGMGWDIVSLFVAAPLLIVGAWFTAGGSFREQLVAASGFFYVFFQYFRYGVTYPFGPLFPAFIALAALGLVGLLWAFFTPPVTVPTADFPRRLVTALLVLVPLLLAAMWTSCIVAAFGGDYSMLFHHPTMPVQFIDLALLCPIGLFVAIAVMLRQRLAYVGSVIFLTYGSLMGLAITAMVFVTGLQHGDWQWAPFGLFAVLFLVSAMAAGRGLRGLEQATAQQFDSLIAEHAVRNQHV